MKELFLLLFFWMFFQLNVYSQAFKKDNRTSSEKEDHKYDLQSDRLSNVDLLQAMELIGLKVHQFNIGTFNSKYSLHFILKEYSNGEVLKTDTLLNTSNTYAFYENDTRYYDYITQIKIFTLQEEKHLKIKISTLSMSWSSKVDYQSTHNDQNYFVRYYSNTSWVENKDIPLLVFASSWKDEKFGFYRFCGTNQLDDQNEETQTLLKQSPHYFKLSYVVSK